ncbi:MAG: sortase, partial [Candidatus Saccharimonadales bacterium]
IILMCDTQKLMDIPELPLQPPNSSKSDPPADEPDKAASEKEQSRQAADMIRHKLEALYNNEPSARAELKEINDQGQAMTPHQAYIQKLSSSGKSIAEIQTAWHEYYESLPDSGKQEVWDEFYSQRQPSPLAATHHVSDFSDTAMPEPIENKHLDVPRHKTASHHHQHSRSVAEHKQYIAHSSRAKQKLSAKNHLQSLIFGLGVGSMAVLLLLFGFFNERFIAPFITPSRHVNSTPIITDPNSTAISSRPEIIIPKINVEIPVVYDEPSIADGPMETALERGVVHYATTPYPGQKGNVVIFGHSSNNIFNPGKYKFAFVLLSKLSNGDLFYLDKGGKRYVYQVYKKYIVQPTDVGVLGSAEKPDTATLITCDPPGTSLHRLIVTGEQISPSPTDNKASTASKANSQPATLPSNAPNLWQRFVNWL